MQKIDFFYLFIQDFLYKEIIYLIFARAISNKKVKHQVFIITLYTFISFI